MSSVAPYGKGTSAAKPSIAALPSFTHSLSAFPTMTAVTSDMVYYGALGKTRSVSEAKLNTALAKHKRDGSQPTSPTSPTSPLASPLDTLDDDEALVIPRRKHRVS
ncbi:hypothetical protein PHLCEN_2v21 [Hermanssonia centrifuga]|uniref:Uncharacterized protein n=1 Tax=Hermanssonia centrifuga TaxID=98765 RepID=A0A2R6S729_9APHY|nr:hypothetical protein PHLCEN_2v21 [Hermanssonia centrifuga]